MNRKFVTGLALRWDVPYRLEKASSIFYLFTAVLYGHSWDNLLLVDGTVMMLW